MATFEVTMKDGTVEVVADADAYQQEGQMTTFFRTQGPRGTVDSWSTRVASFRTAELIIIRRHDDISGHEAAWNGGAAGQASAAGAVTELTRRTA